MDMPLVLRRHASGALVYSISPWYRAGAAAMLCLIVAAIASAGGTGVFGWIFVVGAFVAAFYEERWTFDPARDLVAWRVGLLFLARRRTVAVSKLRRFSLRAYRRGVEDRARGAELADGPAGSRGGRGLEWRVMAELADGTELVIDASRSHGKNRLAAVAVKLSEALGKPFGED
ncbi:MAG: hypothetical protein JXA15_02460 [Spirochaetales bacterium]|nr:hypothetical protein [Spirochaetales bacterium]